MQFDSLMEGSNTKDQDYCSPDSTCMQDLLPTVLSGTTPDGCLVGTKQLEVNIPFLDVAQSAEKLELQDVEIYLSRCTTNLE